MANLAFSIFFAQPDCTNLAGGGSMFKFARIFTISGRRKSVAFFVILRVYLAEQIKRNSSTRIRIVARNNLIYKTLINVTVLITRRSLCTTRKLVMWRCNRESARVNTERLRIVYLILAGALLSLIYRVVFISFLEQVRGLFVFINRRSNIAHFK